MDSWALPHPMNTVHVPSQSLCLPHPTPPCRTWPYSAITATSNSGTSRGRKSSPTRPKLAPQYMA